MIRLGHTLGKAVLPLLLLLAPTVSQETVPPVKDVVEGEKYNYGQVMSLSLLFYEAQRSGWLQPNNRIPWRGNSATNDGSDVGLDLSGGWYDAGDHIKFNFPMAFSTTVLAWGIVEYWDSWDKVGELDNVIDTIKWPLDYLIKCHPDPNTFYVQIGDGGADHNYWGTAESMTMWRPSKKVTADQPGSEPPAEAAAAMAASSLIFSQKGDDVYAKQLITTAKSLFDLAWNHQAQFTASAGFYGSSGYEDELSWAALWLYKATNEQDYLDKAESLFPSCCSTLQHSDGGSVFSWDGKVPGVQLLLWKLTNKQEYKDTVLEYAKFCKDTLVTPKGLSWFTKWASNRFASNSALIILIAADAGVFEDESEDPDMWSREEARQWAKKQLDYILGDAYGGINPQSNQPYRSYVAGYGDNFPRAFHHRGASCWQGTNCNCGWNPEPHILYGALAGGPDANDNWGDNCNDYVQNEVATDYNAAFTSALAAIKHLSLTKQMPAEA